MKEFLRILFFVLNVNGILCSLLLPNIGENNPPPPLNGRVCAYGDMDKDRYTDLIVQNGPQLTILLQSEAGIFYKTSDISNITLSDSNDVYCNVGDFDGNTELDILVTYVHFYYI